MSGMVFRRVKKIIAWMVALAIVGILLLGVQQLLVIA